ncbi:MAG: dsba oxidoreductase [Chloroflexi bacterium]|nr:MAG: dsba oxidoreductase [Chloroflexota bacterium]
MGNREEIKRKKKKQQKRKDLTPIIIIGTLAVVVALIVILTQIKPVGEIKIPDRQKAVQTDGLTMGDPNAKVKVVEFADFQCPACGSYWAGLEPTIIKDYIDSGKAFFTFSPFSFLGNYATDKTWDESVKAAEAAYCANDQGKFWEFHDILFINQKGENAGAFARVRLLAFAKKLNLDSKTFEKCLDSGKHSQSVTDANAYASGQGSNFTPSFLVNGKLVNSGELVQAIEDALK